MFALLQERKYRIVLAANFVSLFGSGLNHAAIVWYVLQQTHSEKSVALLVSVSTLPSLLLLPFTGLLIDRVDRRYLAIATDVLRGVVVGAVALAFIFGRGHIWLIYAMATLLGIGSMIFWPNLSALIQELVEGRQTVQVNALLMGSAQTGWMIAGALVGFFYARLGLAGMLVIDGLTYFASAALYYRLRHGKHLVYRQAQEAGESFTRQLAAGFHFMLENRVVLLLGGATALFQAAMLSQTVLTAPLNDKILHSGAFGYGLCAAGWSLGAIIASGAAGTMLRREAGPLRSLWLALGLTGVATLLLPYSGVLALAVGLYFLMGGGRGMAGVSMATGMIQEVPRHVMGRTQNIITFGAICLQLAMTFGTGWLSERFGLAVGFVLVGGGYLAASALAWEIRSHKHAVAGQRVEAADA